MTRDNISVVRNADGLSIQTHGLAVFDDQPELRVLVDIPELRAVAEDFLQTVIEYVSKRNGRVGADETMAYGCWLTRFVRAGDGLLDAHELDLHKLAVNRTEFVPGIDHTLDFWLTQFECCDVFGANFDPPSPNTQVALSPDVLEWAKPIEAVRYHAPPHMSGWYVTSESFNGKVTSLRMVTTCQVVALRPDLVRWLALPPGWRVRINDTEEVRYDPEVARDTSQLSNG